MFNHQFLNKLSERAKNVCFENNFYSETSLKDYLINGGDFHDLRHCGRKTSYEFLYLITGKKVTSSIKAGNLIDEIRSSGFEINTGESNSIFNNEIETNKSIQLILNDKVKVEMLSFFYDSLIKNLSVRSYNGIKKINDNDLEADVLIFIKKTILNHFDFNDLESVGKKSVQELKKFRVELLLNANKISQKAFSEEDLIIFKIKNKLKINFDETEIKKQLKTKTLNVICFFEVLSHLM